MNQTKNNDDMYMVMYMAVDDAVNRAVRGMVDRAVFWSVYWSVRRAVEDDESTVMNRILYRAAFKTVDEAIQR